MENNSCGGCGCGEHGKIMCGHGMIKYHIIKKIVLIFVIILTFCLGVQLGELRGMIKAYSSRGGMMQWGGEQRFGFDNTNKTYGPMMKVVSETKDTAPTTKETTPKQ